MNDLSPFVEIPLLMILASITVVICTLGVRIYIFLDTEIEKNLLERKLIRERFKKLGEDTEEEMAKKYESAKMRFMDSDFQIGIAPEVGLWQFTFNVPVKRNLNFQNSLTEFTMLLQEVQVHLYPQKNSPESNKFLAWIIPVGNPSNSPIYRIERAVKYIFWRWEQDGISATVEARVVSPRKIEDIEGRWYAQWIAPL